MFARLPKILKSKTYEEGETFYTIILKKRLFLPWLYKTAKLYKNWRGDSSKLEVEIKKYDSKNYSEDIDKGNLEEVFNVEEIINLIGMIRDLPRKTLNKIYRGVKKEIFYNNSDNLFYNAEMQKINNLNTPKESNLECLSKKLSERLYKKALSITQILPL